MKMKNRRLAKTAGILYLGNIITGVFSQLIVRSSLVVPGDAAATATKISGSEFLFRLGVISDLIMMVLFLLFPFCLYQLLKSVRRSVAQVMISLVVIGVAIMSVNMLNSIAPLLLLGGADYLKMFSTNQLASLALFFMNMHEFGYTLAAISYGTWLLPLGFLVYKSGIFPRFLGILLVAGGFGHLSQLLQIILVPKVEALSYPGLAIATVAEFSFCLWLLIKGAGECDGIQDERTLPAMT
jgi:hypothetical protein